MKKASEHTKSSKKHHHKKDKHQKKHKKSHKKSNSTSMESHEAQEMHGHNKLASKASKDSEKPKEKPKPELKEILKKSETISRKADDLVSNAGSLLRHVQSGENYEYKDKKYYAIDTDELYRPSQHLFDDDDSWLTNYQRKAHKRSQKNNQRYKKWMNYDEVSRDIDSVLDDVRHKGEYDDMHRRRPPRGDRPKDRRQ